ncbi:MAG: hypothetical protein M3619_08100, partial [Myxococcota bacterium]|nr:hypothetical protein [Myxococcota bacterium]
YQRYLLDPATGVERIAEVKELLLKLDEQLTILTVRVFPRGSDVSIDGGPFLAVGSSLQTRVRPGLHLVRVRKGEESTELTVNGFEGENKEVTAALKIAEPTPAADPKVVVTGPKTGTTGTTGTTTASNPAPAPPPPERVDAWLTTGTQYGSDGSGRVRQVRAGFGGPVVSAYVPAFAIAEEPDVAPADPDRLTITSGLLAVARIDGQLRGAAGGIGLAISRGRFELDVMVLRSEHTGGYLGGRFRMFTGFLRPYVAVGMPGFVYEQMGATSEDAAETKLAIGVRGAAGVELVVNGHLSVQADLGYEHFFGVDDTPFEADVFVPTVGVIGRL